MCADEKFEFPRELSFVAVSLYYYTVNSLATLMSTTSEALETESAYNPTIAQLERSTSAFCSTPYPELEQRAKQLIADDRYPDLAPDRCFQVTRRVCYV